MTARAAVWVELDSSSGKEHKMKKLMRMLKKEEGQSLVEYALIIALVAIALVAGLGTLAGGIGDTFDGIVAAL